jgi:S-formylglutathione hydrolase FrmB
MGRRLPHNRASNPVRDQRLPAGGESVAQLRAGQQNVSHHYEEFSGGHDWSCWQQHLADSLLFFEEVLRQAPDRRVG